MNINSKSRRMSCGKVIVVTLSEPYPFGNAAARWYYVLLKELSRRGYRVHCFSVVTKDEWSVLAQQALASTGISLSLYPILLNRNWLGRKWRTLRQPLSYTLSDELRRDFEREVNGEYDILHVEQLWSGYLVEGRPRSLVMVHYLRTLDLAGLRCHFNPYLLLSRCLTSWGEQALLRRLHAIGALTDRLSTAVKVINPKAQTFTVPFAIDPSLYRFILEDRHDEPIIGFVASMKWSPGYLAAKRLITNIFPIIKQKVPHARLLLVGWQAREALSEFLSLPNVTIVENVPDPKLYFDKLQVLAYPLPQGSGMMVKIMEAMALGVPVVTTTEGIEGIEAVDGIHCFIADEDAAFAEKVIELLHNSEQRRAFRQNARVLIEEKYAPVPVVDLLERVYVQL